MSSITRSCAVVGDMGKRYVPVYYVSSMSVEDGKDAYYGKVHRKVLEVFDRQRQGGMLLVGGAGCTLGEMWRTSLNGRWFDVVEPSDRMHESGKALYAGNAMRRFLDVRDVGDLQSYCVVVWDAWNGTQPQMMPGDFERAVLGIGLPTVIYNGSVVVLGDARGISPVVGTPDNLVV